MRIMCIIVSQFLNLYIYVLVHCVVASSLCDKRIMNQTIEYFLMINQIQAMCSPRVPKLVAFDLDYTLWPFWVDTHVDPPFMKDKNGDILDMQNKKIKPYKDAPKILKKLHDDGYVLAAVSRTSEIDGANQLIKLFDWDKYFSIKEIYPGCKINHFKKIKRKTNIEFDKMLFFDDEYRNKVDLEKIGVHTVMVKNGINFDLIYAGFSEYAKGN